MSRLLVFYRGVMAGGQQQLAGRQAVQRCAAQAAGESLIHDSARMTGGGQVLNGCARRPLPFCWGSAKMRSLTFSLVQPTAPT